MEMARLQILPLSEIRIDRSEKRALDKEKGRVVGEEKAGGE